MVEIFKPQNYFIDVRLSSLKFVFHVRPSNLKMILSTWDDEALKWFYMCDCIKPWNDFTRMRLSILAMFYSSLWDFKLRGETWAPNLLRPSFYNKIPKFQQFFSSNMTSSPRGKLGPRRSSCMHSCIYIHPIWHSHRPKWHSCKHKFEAHGILGWPHYYMSSALSLADDNYLTYKR